MSDVRYLKNGVWVLSDGSNPITPGSTGTDPPPLPPPPPVTGKNPELPFELEPLRPALAASTRTVFAHYFPPYPIMLDVPQAIPDYYDRNYLNPAWTGGGGVYVATGGFLRDRPIRRAILPGTTAQWKTADMLTEVQRAYQMGLDGFALEILGISGANWDFGNYLVSAIKQFANPNFQFFPQPDGTASGTSDAVAHGNALATLIKSGGVYAYKNPATGRYLVSPFGPEKAPVRAATWGTAGWTTVKDTMAAAGVATDYWMVYVDQWTYTGSGTTRVNGKADIFDSISYGHGRWGDRDPVTNSSGSINTMGAITASETRYGKPFMYPVSVKDERPNQNKYWEGKNTENLRATWMAAINGNAPMVLVPTWNDYSEGAQLSPSVNHGWAYADIFTYYLCWYKLGSPPKIERDCLYLTHRNQYSNPSVMTYTSGQTGRQIRQGQTPASDNAEVLCFLTAPATVMLSIGGLVATFNAPAGVSAYSAGIRDGSVVASATRSGQTIASVTTGVSISHTQPNQNLDYYAASSLR